MILCHQQYLTEWGTKQISPIDRNPGRMIRAKCWRCADSLRNTRPSGVLDTRLDCQRLCPSSAMAIFLAPSPSACIDQIASLAGVAKAISAPSDDTEVWLTSFRNNRGAPPKTDTAHRSLLESTVETAGYWVSLKETDPLRTAVTSRLALSGNQEIREILAPTGAGSECVSPD